MDIILNSSQNRDTTHGTYSIYILHSNYYYYLFFYQSCFSFIISLLLLMLFFLLDYYNYKTTTTTRRSKGREEKEESLPSTESNPTSLRVLLCGKLELRSANQDVR